MKLKDKLPGGKADKKSPKDFDKKALEAGIKVEMEHTNDRSIAQEIAMDHLTEDSNYYQKLKEVEKSQIEKSESSKKDKIKNLVRKLKRKKKQILGQVSITGVTKPQKRAKGHVKETKHAKHEGASKPKGPKKQVMVGKHGGQYTITSGGKKKYSEAKKSLEAFVDGEDKIKQFVKTFRSKNNGQ